MRSSNLTTQLRKWNSLARRHDCTSAQCIFKLNMLDIGHQYRNTVNETTGNVEVVLLSSQHSLSGQVIGVCM
jgi:hypothetical protein